MEKKRILFVPILLFGAILASCDTSSTQTLKEHTHSFTMAMCDEQTHRLECECGLSLGEYSEHEFEFDASENEKYKESDKYNPGYEVRSCGCSYSKLFFNPISSEAKEKALQYDYTYNPESVLIKEKTNYSYSSSDLLSLTETFERDGHHLVYYFEGKYTEGWAGQYEDYFGYAYLWDDGLYFAKIDRHNLRGYWFNSSLRNGNDENNNDIKDCLVLVSNKQDYEEISVMFDENDPNIMNAYVTLDIDSGKRWLILTGSYYYPDVAIEIYFGDNMPRYASSDYFGGLELYRINKKLEAKKILDSSTYHIIIPEGLVRECVIVGEPGEYEIKAIYNNFEVARKIIVY